MTLSPTPPPALLRHQNTRDATKPAWRTPVCRLLPLPVSTQFSSVGNFDGAELS